MANIIPLRICPFCGGKAELSFGGNGMSFVRCNNCGAIGPKFEISRLFSSDEKAVTYWNKRFLGDNETQLFNELCNRDDVSIDDFITEFVSKFADTHYISADISSDGSVHLFLSGRIDGKENDSNESDYSS